MGSSISIHNDTNHFLYIKLSAFTDTSEWIVGAIAMFLASIAGIGWLVEGIALGKFAAAAGQEAKASLNFRDLHSSLISQGFLCIEPMGVFTSQRMSPGSIKKANCLLVDRTVGTLIQTATPTVFSGSTPNSTQQYQASSFEWREERAVNI